MSRKRLGRIDPATAKGARTAAEQAAKAEGAARMGAVTRAPIAQIAAGVGQEIDAEIQRLRTELQTVKDRSAGLTAAEAEGRVLHRLALDQIDLDYIPRDRLAMNRAGEEWRALKGSVAARGQQVPIEVADQGPEADPRYGLIAGMRRILVLQELWHETGEDRFAHVMAVVRSGDIPSTDRLIAMIEENEVRSGISFYERGRIVAMAVRQGVFRDTDQAVDVLFASAQRNRRYKIRCFVVVHDALDGALWYPQTMGERLGIQTAKVIRAGQGPAIRAALDAAGPREAEGEMQLLAKVVKLLEAPEKSSRPKTLEACWEGRHGENIRARSRPGSGRITLDLNGHDVDGEMLERLAAWLGRELLQS